MTWSPGDPPVDYTKLQNICATCGGPSGSAPWVVEIYLASPAAFGATQPLVLLYRVPCCSELCSRAGAVTAALVVMNDVPLATRIVPPTFIEVVPI